MFKTIQYWHCTVSKSPKIRPKKKQIDNKIFRSEMWKKKIILFHVLLPWYRKRYQVSMTTLQTLKQDPKAALWAFHRYLMVKTKLIIKSQKPPSGETLWSSYPSTDPVLRFKSFITATRPNTRQTFNM